MPPAAIGLIRRKLPSVRPCMSFHMAKRGELEPVVRPPFDAPLCDAPLPDTESRFCPLTLCPPTLSRLVLWEPLPDEGGGGGGILPVDEARPAPPAWVRDGSGALGFREDVTRARCAVR